MIKAHQLCKSYRRQVRKPGLSGALRTLVRPEYETVAAVDGVSFEIEKGEMVAYIGPNGAGKSTTLKMLVGILVPSSGTVEVAGLVPHENRRRNALRIGVVFGHRTRLWWDVPVADSFELARHMYRIPEAAYRTNLELFSDLLGLDGFLDTPVRQLSLGQRVLADLCNALLHDPEILFLDEPTLGLDVELKEKVRRFVKTLNRRRRTTVILTTHDISDVAKLCDRVLVIDRGRLVFDGGLDRLEDEYGGDEVLSVDTEEQIEAGSLAALSARPGVGRVEQEGPRLTVAFDRRRIKSAAILELLTARHRVVNFSLRAPEIESVIRRLYRANAALAARPEERRS